MRHIFTSVTLTLLLVGCAAPHERICQHEGPARIGEMAYVNGPVVRVDKVIEDSRCPVDTQCVQAGDVKIAATIIGTKSNQSIELTLRQPLQVADGTLTLLSVTPQRRTNRVIAQENYRFSLDFRGGL